MPQFKSVLVRPEEVLPNGRVKEGVTVWIPLNEAAKGHKVVQKAIDLGVYKPNDPNEIENTAKKLKAREKEAINSRSKGGKD